MEKNHQPLEQLKLNYYNQQKGELEELCALDKKFCRGIKFAQYRTAPSILPEVDPSVWQDWIEVLMSLGNNLTWLLKIPHAEFWCEAVNNFSLQACLDSYLQRAPRFRPSSWSDEVLEKHNALHKLVFLTFIRMASHKETTSCFITPEYFGLLIYDKYLFDIPKIMDLCTLYDNDTNRAILQKAISNLFKHQPEYNEDLENTVATIMEILKSIDRKCGIEIHSDDDTKSKSTTRRPHRLSVGHSNESILLDMHSKEFSDIVSYISDTLHTLKCFMVNVYPAACELFFKNNFVMYLASFYTSTLPIISDALRARPLEDLNLKAQLRARMKICRTSVLSMAREILNECLLQPALNASSVSDHSGAMDFADQYLQILSDLLEENKFFSDFTRKTAVVSDVQSLVQRCPGIDETRAEFILGLLGDGSTPRTKKESFGKNIATQLDVTNNTGGAMAMTKTTDKGINRIELSSLISSVHDVLPDLGKGFIESCLLYFDKDCERTIHALLEGNLPDDLLVMDRTTPLSKSFDAATVRDHQKYQDLTTGILQERQNQYDQDEFDIFHNSSVDFSRVHIGKMNRGDLDEELEMTPELRQRYEEYSSVSNEREVNLLRGSVTLNKEEEDIYDDEYDDMYDGLGVDANDADDTDELLARRPFGTPRVFTQGRKEKVWIEYSESDSEEERNKKKQDHFIANPADVRAKQEEKRRQQRELRNQKKNHGRPSEKADDKPSDNANRDRRKKDINKSRVANHNRKKMAFKKAGKGMGP